MAHDFEGRVVIVTGGGGGIGRQYCREFSLFPEEVHFAARSSEAAAAPLRLPASALLRRAA